MEEKVYISVALTNVPRSVAEQLEAIGKKLAEAHNSGLSIFIDTPIIITEEN